MILQEQALITAVFISLVQTVKPQFTSSSSFDVSSYAQPQAAAAHGDAPFGDATGIAMVEGLDFRGAITETTASAAAAYSSKANAHFLRRGTRADLERIHIERLLGKRATHDWMIAGSKPWLERRAVLEQQNEELAELLAIAEQCELTPDMSSWNLQYDCNHFCGRLWPCAGCNDGIQNGDEESVDCGGSCPACANCYDGVQNGDETGTDCGGSGCEECDPIFDLPDISTPVEWIGGSVGQIAPEPEPDSEGANTAIFSNTCEGGSIHCFRVASRLPPGFFGSNPFYPWTDGSVMYNTSSQGHWESIYDAREANAGISSQSGGRRILQDSNVPPSDQFIPHHDGAEDGMY